MEHTPQRRAVILYEHALLGEGLATYLRAELGVEVVLAPVGDTETVLAALDLAPQVVIFERCQRLFGPVLAELAPEAVLVDVSAVVGRGPVLPQDVTGFESILRAVRRIDVPAPAEPLDAREGVISR